MARLVLRLRKATSSASSSGARLRTTVALALISMSDTTCGFRSCLSSVVLDATALNWARCDSNAGAMNWSVTAAYTAAVRVSNGATSFLRIDPE